MSSVFRTKNMLDTGIDNVFFLEKSCRKMYTIFSAVQRQQRKSDVCCSHRLHRRLLSGSSLQVPHSIIFIYDRCTQSSKMRYMVCRVLNYKLPWYLESNSQKENALASF
jgi:hypothetical protein